MTVVVLARLNRPALAVQRQRLPDWEVGGDHYQVSCGRPSGHHAHLLATDLGPVE